MSKADSDTRVVYFENVMYAYADPEELSSLDNEDIVNYPTSSQEGETAVTNWTRRTQWRLFNRAEEESLGHCFVPSHFSLMGYLENLPSQEHSSLNDYANLPPNALHTIFQDLCIVDLARVLCVCKDWKQSVERFMSTMDKVKYPFYVHLLRFRSWLESIEIDKFSSLWRGWSFVSDRLIKWTTAMSSNLQTLDLDSAQNWKDIFQIAQKCPKLKNLICWIRDTELVGKEQRQCQMLISRLETFVLFCCGRFMLESEYNPQGMCFNKDLVIFSTSRNDEMLSLLQRRPTSRDFLRLSDEEEEEEEEEDMTELNDIEIGLCYKNPSPSVQFNLKYLRLSWNCWKCQDPSISLRVILKYSPELLVFIVEDNFMVSNYELISLKESCLKLKVLWLVNNHIAHRFTHSALGALHNALIQADYYRTYQDFHIVASRGEIEDLRGAAPSFDFIKAHRRSVLPDKYKIRHPYMKTILNHPF